MTDNKLRFSIIITAYNIEDYIRRAIESALNQTYKNFEVIVINDASTDNTLEVIKGFEGITIIDNKINCGLGASRNKCIRAARGEYIIHLDGDDMMYNEEVLSDIDKLIGEENYAIVFLGYQDVGGLGKLRISTRENSTKEARIACDAIFSVSSKCWNRQFLPDNGITFEDGIYYEDMIYSIKTVIMAKKLGCGSFPIFKYFRNRTGSIMTTPNIKRCSDMYRVVAQLMDLYDMASEDIKPYLLSFIKNETENILPKVKIILQAIKTDGITAALPKRDYRFTTL